MEITKRAKYSNNLCSTIEVHDAGELKINTVNGLIERGADVNYQHNFFDGNTPLHLAVIKSDVDIVKLLLKHNADKTILNNDGKSAAELAIGLNNQDVIKLLNISVCRISLKMIRTVKYNNDGGHNSEVKNDFKILLITECPSKSEAIAFLSKQEFKDIFQKALDLFAILIEINSEEIDLSIDQLNNLFADQIMIIFQIKSLTSKNLQTYYKDEKSSGFRVLSNFEMHSQEHFPFETLFNQFGNHKFITDFSLNRIELFDGNNLLYQAVKSNEILCIRFLMLFKWNLHEETFSVNNPIHISLRSHSEKALSALLDLPLNGCENVFILTENQSNLIRMKDDRGCNFLIIAAEHRNSKIIQFLINLDFNINEKFKIGSNFKIASDIAWENRDFETLFQLLKNDSLLPKEFEQSEITNNDKFTELNNLLSERKLIHEKIENGEVENVKNFVNCHCQMKFCFDLENNSALKNALKKSKYEIFALLQSEGFLFGPDEDRDVLLKTLSDNEKKELRSANLKYFINPDNSHIEQLVSVSRLGFGLKNKENGFERIRGFYKELNEIKEVSPLLKIVANAQKVKIIFDFNANSVHNVDPTVSENVRGKAYFIDGHIYIGALRELPEVLGTLAHELCHIAMQMVFDNKCQPFRLENDQNNEETFREIVKKYDSDAIKLKDDIVNRVYTCSFTGEARAAELIVRVPHILAYYKGNNDKINEMKNNFTELFDYYYKLLESDLNEAHSSLEDRIFLKKFNKICGVYDQLEYILHCQEIIPIQLQNQLITIIKTNYPLMMMKNIKNHLETTEKNPQNSLQVFVSLEQFCDEKYSEQIDAIIKLNSRPMFFVAQTVAEHNKNLYFEQLMRKLKNSGIRMIFMIYLKSEIPMEDVDSEKIEIVFKWIDLKKFSQDKLLSQTVNFRGNLLAWKDIFNSQSETLQNLDIHEMNNRKNIFVDIDEKEVKSYLMTNIYISRTFNMEENNSSNIETTKLNKDVLNEDQIIKCAEENKIILIADDAGSGKTTFLRHVRQKLAKNMPQCLVAMIDLKQYTLKFDDMSNEENIQTKLQNIFDISNEFEKKVFKEFLQTGKICLILDGFDEIDDKSRKLVLKFMEEFAALNMNQLWIGSRSHYKVKFAENLVKFSFKMLPFTNDDQRNILVTFWSTENERSTMSLEKVAKDVIEKFASAYCRRSMINFSATPLKLRMLAEIFKHNLSNNDYSQKVLLDSDKTNIYWFYDFFTSKVMENWVPSNPIPFDSGETIIERLQSLRQFHRDYAFKTIFLDIKVANKSMIENLALSNPFSEDLIVKFGILQRSTNSRLFEFSHQTFAEFYAIQYLLNEIMQKELNTEYFDFLCAAFIEIMMLHQKMIRSFLNAALKTKQFESIISNTTFLQTTKKHIFKEPSFKYNISMLLEHFAYDCNEILMGFLLKIVGNDEEFVIELMQKKVSVLYNCITNISGDADIDTLNVILLKFDNNKRLADLFLNENAFWQIALFHAALNKDCKVFKLLVEFLRGFQGEDFNIVSFLNRDDSQKRNVLRFTMSFARSVEILSNLLNNLKHFLPSKSMQKALFTHQNGQTRLYEILGSYRVSFEAFEMFWSFFCEVFNETERKKIFTESNHNGQNILTALAEKGDEVFIDYLLPDIFRTIGKKYFKLQVLLRDENGNNFLHKTAASKSVNGFESILIFMKQNFKIKELKQIFSAKNNFKENCFMRYKPRFTVSLPIIRLAESVLKAEDMKSFLKMKTAFGQNSLNYFVAFGTDKEFNAAWKMYRKHLSVDELKDIMLFQDTMENYPGFKMFTFYKKDIVIRASSLQNYFVQVMILKKQYKQDS